MSEKKNTEKKILTFKGKPLVRCGDVIYYGNKKDRFIIELKIKDSHTLQNLKVSDQISIKLLDTAPNISPNKKIIKISKKNGLFNAIDVASAWLDSALEFNSQQNTI